MQPVRVRFAPSPTGRVHLGSGRTALYDYLIAKQTGGQFILRIEDTDQKRYVPGAEEELINGLRWLGIDWDEGPDVGGPYGPYRQSERKEIYQRYARELIDKGFAYPCFCTAERLQAVREQQLHNKEMPHYDGTCRNLRPEEASARIAAGEPYVVRFKTPKEGTTTVKDLLRGEINIENRQLDDYIIVKSDGLALYHLAAMVDDHLMKITHVIRGSEWLPTFPLHHLIYQAFGWDMPTFIHLSVFLKPSGKGKMSKRDAVDLDKEGYSIFLNDFKDLGYLPEGVVNWIALMGWSYDDHTEFFTMDDLIKKFSFEKLNPSPAAINFEKLDHFNGLHIRSLPVPVLAEQVKPFFEKGGYALTDDQLLQVAPIIQERLVTLDDAVEVAGFLFDEDIELVLEDLIPKKTTLEETLAIARNCYEVLSGLPSLTPAVAEPPMRELVEKMGLKAGQVFGFLRQAATGRKVTPPLFESLEIIGKEKVLSRLKLAIALLESQQ